MPAALHIPPSSSQKGPPLFPAFKIGETLPFLIYALSVAARRAVLFDTNGSYIN